MNAAREGLGSSVVVEGPAGIGKTALLGAAAAIARADDLLVLRGRGMELEREFPMGVVRQLLEPALLRTRDRERLLEGPARLAEPALAVFDAAPGGPAAGQLHGLFWLVANLTRDAPAVIVVDDVQWSDEPSLRFIAYLARRVDSLPVALLLGWRTGEPAPAGTGALLDELARDPATTRLALGPLAVGDVAALLARHGEVVEVRSPLPWTMLLARV